MFVQSDEFSQRNTRRFALDSAHVLSWFTILCFLTYLSYIVFFVPSKVSLVSRTEDISSPRMYCKIHNPIEHLHGMNPSRRNNQPCYSPPQPPRNVHRLSPSFGFLQRFPLSTAPGT